MRNLTKLFFILGCSVSFVSCSSGEKKSEAPPPPPQASLPVVVTPQSSLSGGSQLPVNQVELQTRFDQCMSMHLDTNICSRRIAEDCQAHSNADACRQAIQNLKVLRGQ